MLDAMEIQKKISKNTDDMEKVIDGVQKLWSLVLDHIEPIEGEKYTQPLSKVFPQMSIAEQNRLIVLIMNESEQGEAEQTTDTDKLKEAFKEIETKQKAGDDS